MCPFAVHPAEAILIHLKFRHLFAKNVYVYLSYWMIDLHLTMHYLIMLLLLFRTRMIHALSVGLHIIYKQILCSQSFRLETWLIYTVYFPFGNDETNLYYDIDIYDHPLVPETLAIGSYSDVMYSELLSSKNSKIMQLWIPETYE